MPFQPDVLTEKTLKGFVDKLVRLRKDTPIPTANNWPPKRHACQEELAQVLGFPNWHAAITAVREPPSTPQLAFFGKAPPQEMTYPLEPNEGPMSQMDYEDFLGWANKQNVSDISLQTGESIVLDCMGKRFRATKRVVDEEMVTSFLQYLWTGDRGPGARSTTIPRNIQGYVDLEFAFQARKGVERMRFRVNATSISVDGEQGVQVTMRALPVGSPELSTLNIEPVLLEALEPRPGLVLVGSGTGNGKSTLLASVIRHCAATPGEPRLITTFESPIEFIQAPPAGSNAMITQIDTAKVPLASALRQACQRRDAIVSLDTLRDVQDIERTLDAATSGACVYAGLQSSGVPDMLRRMLGVFSREDRETHFAQMIFGTRVLVAQRLVPTPKGTRVALREFLIFNDEIRQELLAGGIEEIQANCLKLLDKHDGKQGQTFMTDARVKLEQGLITKKEWQMAERMHTSQRSYPQTSLK